MVNIQVAEAKHKVVSVIDMLVQANTSVVNLSEKWENQPASAKKAYVLHTEIPLEYQEDLRDAANLLNEIADEMDA